MNDPIESNFEFAESIVGRWNKHLKEEGLIHGELAYQDELAEFIANELNGRYNVTTKENSSEENRSE